MDATCSRLGSVRLNARQVVGLKSCMPSCMSNCLTVCQTSCMPNKLYAQPYAAYESSWAFESIREKIDS